MSIKKNAFIVLGLCLLIDHGVTLALADKHHHNKSKQNHSKYFTVPQNNLYNDNCGDCHLAYPPNLLPADSWRKIIGNKAEHNGEELNFDKSITDALLVYLEANAADSSNSKLARKIMKSLGSDKPLRITHIPYIIHKHKDDDIPAGVFERKSVGSFSNCNSCHPGAASGYFDDDNVRIPN